MVIKTSRTKSLHPIPRILFSTVFPSFPPSLPFFPPFVCFFFFFLTQHVRLGIIFTNIFFLVFFPPGLQVNVLLSENLFFKLVLQVSVLQITPFFFPPPPVLSIHWMYLV